MGSDASSRARAASTAARGRRFGADWQLGYLVLGIEADAQATGQKITVVGNGVTATDSIP